MPPHDRRARNSTGSDTARDRRGFGTRVSRELHAILTGGNEAPTIANVAARLGLHVRTLQRRLGAEKLVFRDLLSECRRRHAIAALDDSRFTISAIAKQVGYSDPAHFARAFRAWTGRTPSRYRRATGK